MRLRYIAGDVAWATGHMQVDGRDVTVDDVFDGPRGPRPDGRRCR